MGHIERISPVEHIHELDHAALTAYVAARRVEKHNDKPISIATVNKELRTVRAALNKAAKWKFVSEVPEIPFTKEPQHEKHVLTDEEFAAISQACAVASYPKKHS